MAHSTHHFSLVLLICTVLSVGATTTIIVRAGMSGIMAAKTLSDNEVKDFVILEATNRIGGRLHKETLGGYTIEIGANWVEGVGGKVMNPIWPLAKKCKMRTFKSDWNNLSYNIYHQEMHMETLAEYAVELGANWVEGVGGKHINPIWSLAQKYKLRTFYSDWSNLSYNIYRQEGGILPQSEVALPYDLATSSSNFSSNLSESFQRSGEEDVSILASQRIFGHVPETPLEMAIDYYFNDCETGEPPRVTSLKNVLPSPTFDDFGEDEYFVADSRGYEHIVHKIAQEFLDSRDGYISDNRLQLNKVVSEIQYTDKGVEVVTEDGSAYTAENAIVSVSVGILQTKLIKFKPDLPTWKLLSIYRWDMVIYCKIFMKFPSKFWPTGPGTEFFVYAHEQRGYYNFWQAPVGPIYFTEEHTSEKYNGYVHGAYFASIDTANMMLDCMKKKGHCTHKSHGQTLAKNESSCKGEIQREREVGREAWMTKVQVLEDALFQKCKTA